MVVNSSTKKSCFVTEILFFTLSVICPGLILEKVGCYDDRLGDAIPEMLFTDREPGHKKFSKTLLHRGPPTKSYIRSLICRKHVQRDTKSLVFGTMVCYGQR